MIHGLPKTLTVNGREEPIRWEYTAILDALSAIEDQELDSGEKILCFLTIIYENFELFKAEDYEPAFKAAIEFINNGVEDDRKTNVKMIDFDQDYRLMIPAINRVAGKEIRECEDIHWWTFIGWLMEIGECTYGTVLNIRSKKAEGKKLEKWEQEFYNKNKKTVDIQPKLTEEEKEMEKWLNEFLK